MRMSLREALEYHQRIIERQDALLPATLQFRGHHRSAARACTIDSTAADSSSESSSDEKAPPFQPESPSREVCIREIRYDKGMPLPRRAGSLCS
mmetsp:Transcript_11415/g.26230  ORF Transcript_11415/g.26230 Transcript_11415/m.26230 type:complete len:94 (+) Transcript_11415:385-666(+)